MRSLYADHLLARLQKTPDGRLHQRVLQVLQQAITEGIFPPETRLPASRDLAKELNVSRNTVLNAYESLLAEGYVTARTGSGTWVAKMLPEFSPEPVQPYSLENQRALPAHSLSTRGSELLGYANASPYQWGAFVPGAPDVTAFPHQLLRKIENRLQKAPQIDQLIYSNGGGCPHLRQALSEYLRVTRAVKADAEQIIITEGIHQTVDLISRVLADVNDPVWVEDPGYWGTRNILRCNGLQLHALPVDADGMIPDSRHAPLPKMVFVTPSHQYPLGGLMSLARRQQLLDMARRQRFWIIEDDYDSEFRFSNPPHPALQGLEDNAPVLYMGTFSKTLYPALRMGYLVVPKSLSHPLRTAAAELYRGGHLIKQRAIAEFIREGHFAAHIRRMRLLYHQRRQFLLGLISRYLGEAFLPRYSHDAGLHLVLSLPDGCDDVAIASRALHQGVVVRALSQYYFTPQPERGLLLGYACVDEPTLFTAFTALRQCLCQAGVIEP
ncbi:PLP-dependent aminotransferase family protein [Tatumella sp. OPLPL6]|uniref:MocR-like pyridoxine biosynthesis transcription factor PdxR n=1 Tax=Tatumella sp. OPLPL6 TaxID=1928657 RepID=UPI000C17AAC1|nr:PLP-dependent aminotransferase family protein [Tatumella sp. OPLPL6]PIJ43495.1 DNA-binding protein [Tatumella sp. OPLPL6]